MINRRRIISNTATVIQVEPSSTQLANIPKQGDNEARLQNARDFLNYICHEVRNPLNGITMGLTELSSIIDSIKPLLDEQTYSKINELTSDGIFCAAQIEAVVNDQLDLAKIESGKTVLSNSIFDIITLINQASKAIKSTTLQKNVAIEINHACSTLFVNADNRLLLKVLINLLTNAAKFTHEGKISIKTEILEESVSSVSLLIEIKDTGIGMNQEDIPTLFQKFNQKHKNTNRNYGGSGLGLCITKNVIDLMNGTIHVKSQPNKGSTFTINLKFDRPTAEEIAQHERDDTPESEIKQLVKQKKLLKVLLAEDNLINRKLFTSMLMRLGYETIVAENGQIAVEKYKTNKSIDIILMDIVMPVMDGLMATAEIRNYENINKRNRCPIIGLSANSSLEDKQRAIEVGMDKYLSKPLKVDLLLQAIAQAVSASKLNTPLQVDTGYRGLLKQNKIFNDSATFVDSETECESPLSVIRKKSDGVEIKEEKKNITATGKRHVINNSSSMFGIAPTVTNIHTIPEKQKSCCRIM
jgi:signal transduction histidine kinase/DNA-binding response OmpR family regulator